MKKATLFAALVVLLSLVSLACQSQDNVAEENVAERQREEVARETKETIQEAKQAVTVSKTEFKQEVETQLNALERDIDQLEAKAAEVAEENRGEFNAMINELNEKKAAANGQLEQLESASADAWEEVKSGVAEAVNELQNTYDRAASRFQ
jgi:septal ring factor EnvC (AmiA/AmiB activator)